MVLAGVHVALVWLLPYFPSMDGPCHLYNLLILHDLLHGGNEWGTTFSYSLQPLPNYGFELLAYPLIHFFPPLVTEKIFLSIYIVIMSLAAPVLLRAFNRPLFPFAFLVFPIIFNHSLLMGFYSYVITVPLFIFAFSLAWAIRYSSILCKFICYNLSGIVLFYFHLIPSIFFLLSLASISVAESGNGHKKKIRDLFLLIVTISPFLLNLFFYFKKGSRRNFPDLSYLLSFKRISDLMADLLSFSTINLSPWQSVPGALFMALVIAMVYLALKEARQAKSNILKTHASEKTLLILASVFTLIYLLAPYSLGGGSCFNQRLPWVIFLIMLPLLRFPQATIFQHGTAIVAGLAVLFFASNAAILWSDNLKIERFLSGLHIDIPRGSFVMTYKTKLATSSRVDTLLHAASYYGIKKGCVDVGDYEASFDYFRIRFRKGISPIPPQEQISFAPTTINLAEYPSIRYLLGWETNNKERAELNNYYRVIYEDEPLTVWQRN
jgi:hypothetical protein